MFSIFWFFLLFSRPIRTVSFTIHPLVETKSITSLKVFEAYDSISGIKRKWTGIKHKWTGVKRKWTGVNRIIRPENILPTTLLCTTGGWLANPSILKSPAFYASTIITLLVMSASMIINDLFDYNIDKINNPNRPLITGELSRREATGLTIGIFLISKLLSYQFLPKYMGPYLNTAILTTMLYTPLLKRVPLIKNISCAALISFAPFFTGLSNCGELSNPLLLTILSRLVFLGSLQNELLLDICDMDGDRINKIPTVPVIFGKYPALFISIRVLVFNILTVSWDISRFYGMKMGIVFTIIYLKSFSDIIHIPKNGFSKDYIKYTISNTVYPFIQSLVYFSVLALGDRVLF